MAIKGFFWRVKEFLQTPNPKSINIIAGQDGRLYEIRDHLLGRLVVQKDFVRELDPIQPGFQFQLSKIPGTLLQTALSFFRAYCNEWVQNEVMVQIYYDRLTKEYFMECPYQTVSKARIDAKIDHVLLHNQQYVQVMHLHSHNTMSAFFSETDNNDEKGFMLYGVIGRLDFHEPDMRLRVGCNGHFFKLPIDYIFDHPVLTPTSIGYPKEWDERVLIQGS
ncbi:Mov34/MPN/PAD-1 family protein [Ammoniphilus resinae]|uniref:PRTRC genetic system protein A n=1 Tax=Ammoniphilus resinae TaxID=861532 RepID=A0ABS4GNA6_9BACL|nr:Mov34/MPN/PAD-1 family protein [Ammoniphilus resinae]MBP1931754.1 PRTRC genetic system protein A [Ammoniphilus resinae]